MITYASDYPWLLASGSIKLLYGSLLVKFCNTNDLWELLDDPLSRRMSQMNDCKLILPSSTLTEEFTDYCCPICLEPLSTNQEVTKLPCTHMYHTDHIQQWFTRSLTCPLCRMKILE